MSELINESDALRIARETSAKNMKALKSGQGMLHKAYHGVGAPPNPMCFAWPEPEKAKVFHKAKKVDNRMSEYEEHFHKLKLPERVVRTARATTSPIATYSDQMGPSKYKSVSEELFQAAEGNETLSSSAAGVAYSKALPAPVFFTWYPSDADNSNITPLKEENPYDVEDTRASEYKENFQPLPITERAAHHPPTTSCPIATYSDYIDPSNWKSINEDLFLSVKGCEPVGDKVAGVASAAKLPHPVFFAYPGAVADMSPALSNAEFEEPADDVHSLPMEEATEPIIGTQTHMLDVRESVPKLSTTVAGLARSKPESRPMNYAWPVVDAADVGNLSDPQSPKNEGPVSEYHDNFFVNMPESSESVHFKEFKKDPPLALFDDERNAANRWVSEYQDRIGHKHCCHEKVEQCQPKAVGSPVAHEEVKPATPSTCSSSHSSQVLEGPYASASLKSRRPSEYSVASIDDIGQSDAVEENPMPNTLSRSPAKPYLNPIFSTEDQPKEHSKPIGSSVGKKMSKSTTSLSIACADEATVNPNTTVPPLKQPNPIVDPSSPPASPRSPRGGDLPWSPHAVHALPLPPSIAPGYNSQKSAVVSKRYVSENKAQYKKWNAKLEAYHKGVAQKSEAGRSHPFIHPADACSSPLTRSKGAGTSTLHALNKDENTGVEASLHALNKDENTGVEAYVPPNRLSGENLDPNGVVPMPSTTARLTVFRDEMNGHSSLGAASDNIRPAATRKAFTGLISSENPLFAHARYPAVSDKQLGRWTSETRGSFVSRG